VISFKCRQPGHLARECPSSGGVVIIPMVEVLTDMVAAMVIATLLVLAMAFMCHTLCEVPPFLSIWLVEVSPSNLNDQNGKSMNILLQR
jgi:cytochrome c biogenesis factor